MAIGKEISDFIKHLRLHYQFLLLSSTFLLGGLFSSREHLAEFLIQYLNVHIFLFGGVTAYNSYWDKDKGPIGGMKQPPLMRRWMHHTSLVLQFIGLIIAFISGIYFAILYICAMILSVCYSKPSIRWKGRPFLSLIVIGLGNGIISYK